jgi:hypothetical protein
MYCPNNSKGDWQTLAREQPVTFRKAVKLEAEANLTKENKIKLRFSGKQAGFRHGIPLMDFTAKDYERMKIECKTCGREQRASKVVGSGWLTPEEYVQE